MLTYLSGAFEKPTYICESAWLEHGPFAMWLVHTVRPRKLVELGTHWGFSYFAFCESAVKHGIDMSAYAIDTWQGDNQAGLYGEEVFQTVAAHNAQHFSGMSKLIRSRFNEALDHFDDASIDILHIDGRHGYEDVAEDFRNWYPKVADGGLILFHDTQVEQHDFGVKRLFEELCRSHPSFEFSHGHGLGILSKGLAANLALRGMCSLTDELPEHLFTQQTFAASGKIVLQEFLLQRSQTLIGDQLAEINTANNTFQDLNAKYSELKKAMDTVLENLSTSESAQQALQAVICEQANHIEDSQARFKAAQRKNQQLLSERKADIARLAALEKQSEDLRLANGIMIDELTTIRKLLRVSLDERSVQEQQIDQLTQKLVATAAIVHEFRAFPGIISASLRATIASLGGRPPLESDEEFSDPVRLLASLKRHLLLMSA